MRSIKHTELFHLLPRRQESSNNRAFFFFFFGGQFPARPPVFIQILVVSFATQAGACILSDYNIFYTSRGGRTTAGSNAPGAFLVVLVLVMHLSNTLPLDIRESLGVWCH